MGYDISPDMVRLSLVNMYLHGLVNPHIYEYDTLTSEERWKEFADVILANPPFMSPKGGIRPHNRFSVQSKRSEVLFVDYMAEHLNAGGRAGIIVPEGIIFQSQNAHKQLRKKLVEECLVAVVSLPSGVFNPYSGVKTSILLLDKALARKTDRIAFFKVENDGYNLGAQRRPIERNDLPQVQEEILACLHGLRSGTLIGDQRLAKGFIVKSERIAADGEFNLSGERYCNKESLSTSFPSVSIGSHVNAITPPTKIRRTEYLREGLFPIIDQSQEEIAGWTNEEKAVLRPDRPFVVFGDHTCAVKLIGKPFAQGADGIKILRTDENLDPRFLYSLLRIRPFPSTGYRRHFSLLKRLRIPLPPLNVQQKIVSEIEGYQKVIDGARAVVENYRPHIHIDPDWLPVKIGDLVENVLIGLVRSKADQNPEFPYKYIKMNNITRNGTLDLTDLSFVNATPEELNRYSLRNGDYLYNTRNSPDLVGKSAVFFGKANIFVFNNNILRIRFCPEAIPAYVNLVMNSEFGKARIRALVDGTTSVAALYQKNYLAIEIPLPPFKTQQAIVAEIEAEQSLVNANRELINRFEKKIQDAIARVWGDEA